MTGTDGAASLADRFFALECNPNVRALLQEEIATRTSGSRYFTFNVFNVCVDVTTDTVTIEDELDADAEESMTLAAFVDRLERLG